MLAYCSPSSKWVPDGNTREAKVVRKGTGHPTSHADGSRISVLSNRHPPTYESIWDYLYL